MTESPDTECSTTDGELCVTSVRDGLTDDASSLLSGQLVPSRCCPLVPRASFWVPASLVPSFTNRRVVVRCRSAHFAICVTLRETRRRKLAKLRAMTTTRVFRKWTATWRVSHSEPSCPVRVGLCKSVFIPSRERYASLLQTFLSPLRFSSNTLAGPIRKSSVAATQSACSTQLRIFILRGRTQSIERRFRAGIADRGSGAVRAHLRFAWFIGVNNTMQLPEALRRQSRLAHFVLEQRSSPRRCAAHR